MAGEPSACRSCRRLSPRSGGWAWRSPAGCTGRGGRASRRFTSSSNVTSRSCCESGPAASPASTARCDGKFIRRRRSCSRRRRRRRQRDKAPVRGPRRPVPARRATPASAWCVTLRQAACAVQAGAAVVLMRRSGDSGRDRLERHRPHPAPRAFSFTMTDLPVDGANYSGSLNPARFGGARGPAPSPPARAAPRPAP